MRGNHILGPRISIKFLLLAKCLDQGCGPVRAVRLSERHLAVLIGTCIAATTARPIAEVSHPQCRTMTQSISLGHPAAGKILINNKQPLIDIQIKKPLATMACVLCWT